MHTNNEWNKRLLEIESKILEYLKQEEVAFDYSLEELVNKSVINYEEFQYLKNNNVQYNPPTSADLNDNFVSIFNQKHEDGSSSHIFHTIVDKSRLDITKNNDISSLSIYIKDWFEFKSDNKSLMLLSVDENCHYMSLVYFNNKHWDRQYLLNIYLLINDIGIHDKVTAMINRYNFRWHDYERDQLRFISILLPSQLDDIILFAYSILREIFFLKDQNHVKYIANGFRFTT